MTRPDEDIVWITLTSLAAVAFLVLVVVSIAKCCKRLVTRHRMYNGNTHLLCETESSTSIVTEMHELKPYIPSEVKNWKRVSLINRNHRTMCQENLLLLKKLANGRYGAIYEAELYDLNDHASVRKVVAKLLQNTQASSKKQFEDDIEQLSKFNHKHMVGLLAQFTEEIPKCYVMDCGQTTDLLEYVRNLKNKSSTIQKILQESSEPIVDETEEDESIIENAVSIYEELLMDLLIFADHISLGMAYLSSLNQVHKDLALRNCIIGHDNVVKVTTDTELAKARYPEVYSTGLPIRWMSPESLFTNTFTTHNDVWSYGVVLWELITLGEVPYSPINDDALISAITTDHEFTLEKPILCSENMFAIMVKCWSREPTSRPSFLHLHEQIYKLTISS